MSNFRIGIPYGSVIVSEKPKMVSEKRLEKKRKKQERRAKEKLKTQRIESSIDRNRREFRQRQSAMDSAMSRNSYVTNGTPTFIKKNRKPKQTKMSFGEKEVARNLTISNIQFIYDRPFRGLINPLTGKKLRFDFYLPKHKAVIEFDGIQHAQYVKDFHVDKAAFASQVLRDCAKDEFCRKNNIRMLRIKHTEYNKVWLIVQDFLKELK